MSKTAVVLAVLLLLPLASNTSAQTLPAGITYATAAIPANFGAQWSWAAEGIVFAPAARAPHAGGLPAVRWPEGAVVLEIAWQSSVKVAGEVLYHLVASPTGSGINEPGRVILLSTHHVGEGPTMLVKRVAPSKPIPIPKGWVTWVYGEGSGAPHGAPAEVQFTFYTRGRANWVSP